MSKPSGNSSGRCSLVRPLSPARSTLQLLYAEPLCLTTSEEVPLLATGEQNGPQVLVVHLELARTAPATDCSTHVQQPDNQRRVMGMLFQGPVQVAEYTWPLVAPSSSSRVSTHITAAMVLPELQSPGVLQLVLLEQTLVAPFSAPGSSSAGDSQAGWVSSAAFARLPLLFLPAGAAQEVEALLAPAMRQEAAAAAPAGSGGTQFVPDAQQVSTAVWHHWQALVDDMHAVLELANHLSRASPAGRAHSSSSSSSSTRARHLGSSAGTVPAPTLKAAAVQQQVLPVVLGFLQQQGLHQCCAALLRQLPPTVAAAWQQQVTRQAYRSSSSSPSLQSMLPPVQEDAQQQKDQQQQQHSRSAADVKAPPLLVHKQGSGATSSSSDCVTGSAAMQGGMLATSSHAAHQQGREGVTPSAAAAAASPASSSSQGTSSSHTGAGSSHQVSPPEVTWVTPWCLFPGDMEQQFLQYKHTTYLWLDHYVAAFTALYMWALVARMVWERDVAGTACYLYYITCKCIPYISLWRGQLDVYFRDRERLITWHVQWLCMMPILLRALCCDGRITPVLQQALRLVCAGWWQVWQQLLSWQPFQAMVHLLQALVSAGLSPHLTGPLQHNATTAAAVVSSRVVNLHSGMCQLLMLPESPMRAFWKLKGEFLVIGLMPIPQNVRLRWHVPSITLEVVAMVYTFGLLFDWRQVVARYAASLCLSVCASWWWDFSTRTRFRAHLQLQAAAAAAALARKQQQLQAFEG